MIDRNVSRLAYEALRTETDITHQHPLGLISHAAVLIDGTITVIEVWESARYADRFDEEVLIPALEAVRAPLGASVAVFDLVDLVTP